MNTHQSSSLSLKICTSSGSAHAKRIWAHRHRQALLPDMLFHTSLVSPRLQTPLFPLQIQNVSMLAIPKPSFLPFYGSQQIQYMQSIKCSLLSCNEVKENNLWQGYDENMAMVRLDSMQKANSTLEDFCRSYFMFHGLDVSKPESIFKYLPILSFTESYIYQLDNINEYLLQAPKGKHEIAAQDLVSCFSNDPFRPLMTVLEDKGLLTERMREELRDGEEYWRLERKLCHALTNKEEILIDDVMKAIHLKSFDYRVMNLLLYQLQGAKVDELHMEFFSISEFLMEISDDLHDYEDNVLENSFNILRMFIGIYGGSTAPAMLAKCITEAESKYESLLKLLDPQLSQSYQKRCAEITKQGGNISENPLGTWSIPTVIQDEELYRKNFKSDTS